jgi:hypothetical protein
MIGTPRERSIYARSIGKLKSHKFKPQLGEHNGASKLTAVMVAEIRNRYATGRATQRALAEEYSVHRNTIFSIIHNRLWRSEGDDAGQRGTYFLPQTMSADGMHAADRPEAPVAEVLFGRLQTAGRPRDPGPDAETETSEAL